MRLLGQILTWWAIAGMVAVLLWAAASYFLRDPDSPEARADIEAERRYWIDQTERQARRDLQRQAKRDGQSEQAGA